MQIRFMSLAAGGWVEGGLFKFPSFYAILPSAAGGKVNDRAVNDTMIKACAFGAQEEKKKTFEATITRLSFNI